MTVHPDDQAFLDAQHWVPGSCAMGTLGHQADGRVVEIDHVEQGTLAGHPIYSCRGCLEYRLRLDRAWADGDPEYRPQLRRPRLADGESTGLRDVAPILRRDGARRVRALRGGC